MAKKPAAVAPLNPLAALAKAGTRKPAAPKKDERTVIVLSDADQIEEIGDMIRLGVLMNEVKPLAEAHKKSSTQILFRDWVARMWDKKKVPDNPRIVIKKDDSALDDMSVMFQVKFRADGLDVPDLDDLPEGTTIEDTLIDSLTSPLVGMSAEKAAQMVAPDTGEITIDQVVNFADSFNAMHTSDEHTLRSAANKVMSYIQAAGKGGRVTVDAMTPDELAAIISVKQVVRLKDGFMERAFLYCDSEEQLHKLLLFVKTTLVVSHFEFAKADKKSERISRMQATVEEFLGAEGEDEG